MIGRGAYHLNLTERKRIRFGVNHRLQRPSDGEPPRDDRFSTTPPFVRDRRVEITHTFQPDDTDEPEDSLRWRIVDLCSLEV
jgi:hypothetical protein